MTEVLEKSSAEKLKELRDLDEIHLSIGKKCCDLMADTTLEQLRYPFDDLTLKMEDKIILARAVDYFKKEWQRIEEEIVGGIPWNNSLFIRGFKKMHENMGKIRLLIDQVGVIGC